MGAELREVMTHGDEWEVYHALFEVVYSIDADAAVGFFRHCGYLP